MATHFTVLAVLYILASAGELLAGLSLLLLGTTIPLFVPDVFLGGITAGVSFAVGIFMLALAIPGLALAYGLLKRRSWARVLGIVLGVLNLINFPLGTVLGVYTLWVLTRDEAKALLSGGAAA